MKTIQKIIPVLLLVTLFISCKKEKVAPKVKEVVQETKTKVNENLLEDRTAFDYKLNHLETLADLERIKLHFIAETDKFKTEEDIKKLENRLSKLEQTSNKDFNASIQKIESQLKELKTSMKNGDKTAKNKLEKLSQTVANEIKKLDSNMKADTKKLSNDVKRQYEEVKAKTNLYKAKIALENKKYDKADVYLDQAYANYEEAKKYGDDQYKTTITNLQSQIKALKTAVDIEKPKELDVIIIDVEKNH